MTSDDNATPESEIETGANAPETETGQAEAIPEDRIAQLEAENAELKDRVLRMAAETENVRKRAEREVGDTRAYAIAGFARDMLVATDNLARALMVIPEEDRTAAEGTLKSLIEGIEMTEREMQRLLQKHGVKPVEAQGEKFDPHRHQAMFEVPDTTVPEGTVVQVVQAGYAIGERVLRPAMVGVSKGGPKRGAEQGAPDGQTGPKDSNDGESIDKSV